MTFQVMRANKALVAEITLVLTVSEMCLNVGSDVFFSPKTLPTLLEHTRPFPSLCILFAHVFTDIFLGETSIQNRAVDLQFVELFRARRFGGAWL